MKRLQFFSLLFVALLTGTMSCKKLITECTEEFRMIIVNVNKVDNTPAEIDDYYMVRTSDNDTILSMNNNPYEDDFFEGITIFTDAQMNKTIENGTTFILSCYWDNKLVVNETYVISHNQCHIQLESGKTNIRIVQ
jgi:hypothetical protein